MTTPHVIPSRSAAWRLLGTLAAVATVASACSLPADERVTPLDADEIPDAIANTTTTTTTTTTTSTTSTTLPSDPDAVGEITTTTTTPPFPTAPVTVYYTLGLTDDLQLVTIDRPAPVPERAVIDLLESPSGIAEFGLRSSVRFGLIDDISIDNAIATITLDPVILDRMPTSEQERAIAQIVLTLTSFTTPDQGNVGFVKFEVEGEGYPVFIPALGGTGGGDEELAFSDFSMLIANTTSPTPTPTPVATTTTTTTTTATTAIAATTTTSPSAEPESDETGQ